MPELPEVEAARRAIEENCLNKRIVRAIIADDSKVVDAVSHSDFEASLVGKTIVSARRKGKNMWLHLDSPPSPTFQFGMAGAVYIKGVAVTKYKSNCDVDVLLWKLSLLAVRWFFLNLNGSAVNDTDEWPSKYSKFFIQLEDGLEMSFTDKRRFAKVRLLKDPTMVPPISELGPDALLEPMPVDEFTKCLSKKKTSIKALLLDQGFISGIGNWIADEVLYQAKIHPLQTAASLSKESCATLIRCIKEVIEKAVEVGADSSQYPSNWLYHSREKKPGKAFVDGKKIDFITAGGRTSAYVPELQKLPGDQAKEALVKSGKQGSKRKKGEKDEDGEADEPTSEEAENTDTVKSKKGLSSRGAGKKAPRTRKSQKSDDDNDDDQMEPASEGEDNQKMAKPRNRPNARGGGKKPSKAGKSKGSSDNDSDDADPADESEDGDDKKKKKTAKKTKKTQEATTGQVETKKARQPKKAK